MLLKCESSSSTSYCQKHYLLLNTFSVREKVYFIIWWGENKIIDALVQLKRNISHVLGNFKNIKVLHPHCMGGENIIIQLLPLPGYTLELPSTSENYPFLPLLVPLCKRKVGLSIAIETHRLSCWYFSSGWGFLFYCYPRSAFK